MEPQRKICAVVASAVYKSECKTYLYKNSLIVIVKNTHQVYVIIKIALKFYNIYLNVTTAPQCLASRCLAHSQNEVSFKDHNFDKLV